MTLFYKKLSEGYDKSEALRYAKIDFIKQHSPNPYYWGAFIISGDISDLKLPGNVNSTPYIYGIIAIIFLSAFFIVYHKRKSASL